MSELPQLFDLTGRAAIVTGGAGLLGAEFCRTLAEAGANALHLLSLGHGVIANSSEVR